MLEVAKTIEFSAAHRLPAIPDGHKCSGLHGHMWTVRVWVTGEVDPVTGWIVDFAELETIVRREAIDTLDHSVLNDAIANPTAENLCMWLYGRIAEPLTSIGARVTRIDIRENRDMWCRLTVEDPR